MKKITALMLAATISLSAHPLEHMKPLEEPALLLKGDIMSSYYEPRTASELANSLINAKDPSTAIKTSQAIIQFLKSNPAEFDKMAEALLPLFTPPHLDLKKNKIDTFSKVAFEIFKAFPEKTIDLSMKLSNDYLMHGPDEYYNATGYLVSKLIAEVPQVRPYAKSKFTEIFLSEENWGAKVIAAGCAVQCGFTELADPLSTAALNAGSILSTAPKGVQDILYNFSKELISERLEELRNSTPRLNE